MPKEDQSYMEKFGVPGLVIIAATALIVTFVRGGIGGRPAIHYPYVCSECHAVMDYSELAASPDKWRVPKGAPNDSVVICLRCNKGWAYRVHTCEVCGTKFIMYINHDHRCPKCFPEAAEKARKYGVDIMFKK